MTPVSPLSPPHDVEIVEVGPRDGFQPIGPFIPTSAKIEFVRRLKATGLRRVEIGSFVSAAALPQMADTPAVLDAVRGEPGLLAQVLVPTERRGREAVAARAPMIAYVLSVSPAHNRNNVRRSPEDSAADYERLLAGIPDETPVRLNLATAFDCPFDGRVEPAAVMVLLDRLVPLRAGVEICLCDTTGRAVPDQMRRLFGEATARFPGVRHWAMHAHDTYGLGLANVFAAYEEGVRVFDGAFAGLGGCPFAPGATGNVASEDLAWMFERMGVSTGIDVAALADLADEAAALPGAQPGGRARAVLRARPDACAA
ncbi:hydroxymethylglutaryl-CoA lyase [Aureimonas pseudogalii]|uniref:Hydroxymethylglutaryl-CoA lyase n=1 Tax=Aureimonas pseudogalii TaxID=1744844 RepID=A0A7W6H7J8_9HYPH|nr:hydroxymethylglutaryl-CoA lyase [Aureimonas pseudogalii]MBB3999962.1 hydroxymethylglutaryl-CoA lyase [Aureimonas pseudogalii]